MARDGRDELQGVEYVPNRSGIIFYGVYMACILVAVGWEDGRAHEVQTSVLYVAEVPLESFGSYERPIYTFLCGITLGLFPLTLLMTFTPFNTPWREAVLVDCRQQSNRVQAALLYMVHAMVTGGLFLLTTEPFHQVLALGMLLADVLMVISLLAGYDSGVATLLPYRLSPQEASVSDAHPGRVL